MKRNEIKVYAAIATPVDKAGRLDEEMLAEIARYITARGVDGIVTGGATGEYARLCLADRVNAVRVVRLALPETTALLMGIGGESAAEAITLSHVAAEYGCERALLSTPSFFRYRSDDLIEYIRTVSERSPVPCLYYHLPAFTNALSMKEAIGGLLSEGCVAGLKDSSGEVANLNVVSEARCLYPFEAYVGNDARIFDALNSEWDGVISGLACIVPELVLDLARHFEVDDWEAARERQVILNELIAEVEKLPIPWGVRLALRERGFAAGELPLPLSVQRRKEVAAFGEWFRGWLERAPAIVHTARTPS